jgi:hypothetical protein
MAQRRPRTASATPRSRLRPIGEPLYLLPIDDEGKEWRSFWSEEGVDAAITDDVIRDAQAMAGAWSDLDADEILGGLERLRQERKERSASRSSDK